MKDNEWAGLGNSLNFDARMYDSRIARFRSLDPLVKKYPDISPYCFADNNPIALIDDRGEGPEKPTTVKELRKAFDDGKKAASYGFIIYVDQPVRGTRYLKVDRHFAPGHTFIKLIKINEDGTKVERVFGFYPKTGTKAGPYNGPVQGEFG